MKYIYFLLSIIVLFLACSDSEKQKLIDVIQNINIRDNEKVDIVATLSDKLSESSGLAYIDGTLWTHNDSGGEAKLYAIDKSNGKILKTVTVLNASNIDWEDLAFNQTHLFIGDFGNNKGTRRDLKIYKIKRDDLKTKTEVKAEVIEFSYATQTDFKSNPNTNYDCEAFIAYEDKLYLFSKNHGNRKTDMYVIGTDVGVEVAEKVSSFNTQALVTGASIDVQNRTLALIGYSTRGNPKSWIFSNFVDADFFKGEQSKIIWGSPAKAQIEGVTHIAKGKLYISSEKVSYLNNLGSFNLKPKLYELDY